MDDLAVTIAAKILAQPALSAYLRTKKGVAPSAHQQFLKRFTYGFWQEYSGISRPTFQGLLPIAIQLSPKDLPHELRPTAEDQAEGFIGMHIPRAAAILLCTLTEVQACFRFEGARINQRLHSIWDALRIVPEIKELYEERCVSLMRARGIDRE